MSGLPGVTAADLETIKDILGRHLAAVDATVLAFGSRVEGKHRPDSDLDLLIQCDRALGLAALGALREDLEHSPLPFRVDLLEERRIPESMRRSIAALGKVKIL